ASQKRAALLTTASNTVLRSVGEVLMILRISAVAACCSSASANLFSKCARGSRLGLTRVLAFVPVERSLRPRVGLFAPLRDKVTSSAQSLVPPSGRHQPRIEPVNPNRTAR